ncbi:U-box domain protein [Taphrina deformans PYCC 5710]|uniref:RING-type E3 ubiquitin transferase n=1 Tax=Taphrina deformans (strain PYCC 5710 / ATCC 11124 / CBS 356.35 / IMI 108563 / JCM 9778 / NBRC 8474) TaxID=1097556 RepID=R4X7V5_TAPDE|nr:U-box domain protein [Taphrina deformans PYCC 5710]|eukprot:CCG81515.1 U-box domain protein [Taphrina deformans PYCC 5710]
MSGGQYKSAEALKLDGNAAFKDGKYEKAMTSYTQAITKSNGRIPTYFTNRALCRLKTHKDSNDLESVIGDCQRALDLLSSQDVTFMKANYYIGQAQLELGRPNEAYTSLVKAYRTAIREKNASIFDIKDALMDARKQRWARSEKKRLEEEGALAQKLKSLIESECLWQIQIAGDDESRVELAKARAEEGQTSLQNLLQRSDERYRIREVPDYFVCPISLSIFSDPVITPSGRSYERTAILQHLKHNPFDPMTREPLIASKIFDNISLRDACEDFLKHNGWAVDY